MRLYFVNVIMAQEGHWRSDWLPDNVVGAPQYRKSGRDETTGPRYREKVIKVIDSHGPSHQAPPKFETRRSAETQASSPWLISEICKLQETPSHAGALRGGENRVWKRGSHRIRHITLRVLMKEVLCQADILLDPWLFVPAGRMHVPCQEIGDASAESEPRNKGDTATDSKNRSRGFR